MKPWEKRTEFYRVFQVPLCLVYIKEVFRLWSSCSFLFRDWNSHPYCDQVEISSWSWGDLLVESINSTKIEFHCVKGKLCVLPTYTWYICILWVYMSCCINPDSYFWVDLTIRVFVSYSYFCLCHVVFKVLYRFWHLFPFTHTILTYSCIYVMFILLPVSCFYRVLIIFVLCSIHIHIVCILYLVVSSIIMSTFESSKMM